MSFEQDMIDALAGEEYRCGQSATTTSNNKDGDVDGFLLLLSHFVVKVFLDAASPLQRLREQTAIFNLASFIIVWLHHFNKHATVVGQILVLRARSHFRACTTFLTPDYGVCSFPEPEVVPPSSFLESNQKQRGSSAAMIFIFPTVILRG